MDAQSYRGSSYEGRVEAYRRCLEERPEEHSLLPVLMRSLFMNYEVCPLMPPPNAPYSKALAFPYLVLYFVSYPHFYVVCESLNGFLLNSASGCGHDPGPSRLYIVKPISDQLPRWRMNVIQRELPCWDGTDELSSFKLSLYNVKQSASRVSGATV